MLDGITTEYEDLLDALRRYPPAERAQETLYYECEIPQDTGASYHRADALLRGSGRLRFAKCTAGRSRGRRAMYLTKIDLERASRRISLRCGIVSSSTAW